MPTPSNAILCLIITGLALSISTSSVQATVKAPCPKTTINNKEKAQCRSILLESMSKELERAFKQLKNAGEAPLYFLSYTVYDSTRLNIQASHGALYSHNRPQQSRYLDLSLRVGSPKVDNTHKLRRGSDSDPASGISSTTIFPDEDDRDAIAQALWERTDTAFKEAQNKFRRVTSNKHIKVQEEDTSDDFSTEVAQKYASPTSAPLKINQDEWEKLLKELSSIFKQYPSIQDSNISFTANKTRRYMVNSEGSNIEDESRQYRISILARATCDDGMKIWLYDGIEARQPEQLPGKAELVTMVEKLARDITALKTAKRAEPYAGPAILKAKAAGVFFHEIFGHRIEGHRQKDESEGRTFTKKIGTAIMPEFITIVDNPALDKIGNRHLNGHYKFDDEGVPAQKVTLVEKGILKNFLMGRSPIQGFEKSNGHGRCSQGKAPVARQGNLIIDSSKRVSSEKLRELLIAEVKRQGKPYGLIFDEIAGGFTMTQTFFPQSFKLLPLRVWRVYPDGRPDELLRGVDLVGTPLTCLERIVATSDDDATFNGTCGAESGWVPVSASSPSLLVNTIEVELQSKDQEKPPLLPAPSQTNSRE
jgi:predicted Zn-dependent protease